MKFEPVVQLGAMLKAMAKVMKTKGIGNSLVLKENRTPTLSEPGLDKKTFMVGQQIAARQDDVREEIVTRENTSNEPQREQQRARVSETFLSLPI